MTFSFNLIDQPWIPVVDLEGVCREVSLQDALINAYAYRQLSANFPQTNAALYRLLLAVLHRNFGPANEAAWEALWQRGAFESAPLTAYLLKCYARFDLFAEKQPFFQNRHPKVEIKPINTLLFLTAGGNAETLFDHAIDDHPLKLTPAQAALALITAQSFDLAGLAHPQLKLFYTDAPCARAPVFLLQGKTLFESLMLNLIRYNKKEPFVWPSGETDYPAWEMADPFEPERNTPVGYLDYLTWPSRRIMLFPKQEEGSTVVSRMTTAPGLTLSAEVLNPMHHYRVDEKTGIKPLRFSEGKALWRDSSALLNAKDKDHDLRPKALLWAASLRAGDIPLNKRLTLAAYGMSTDPGKKKVFFYRAEQFEFDNRLLVDESLAEKLDSSLALAEAVSHQLYRSAGKMADLFLYPDKKEDAKIKVSDEAKNLLNCWGMEAFYWSRLEVPFFRFLDALPEAPQAALSQWKTDLRQAALAAFQQAEAMAGNNARALKASAKSRRQLYGGLKSALAAEI